MNFYILILVFFTSFFLTWIVKNFALKKSIIDIPNERSSHTTPTPRGGGIAIVISWYLCITYLFIISYIDKSLYLGLLSGLLLAVISVLDDIFEIKPAIRLIFQCIVSALALYFIGGMQKIDFGFYIFSNTYILTVIGFFIIVWFINLFNFIDGIDGYAATETIFISLSIFLLFGDFLLLILAIAVFGFLFWNWQKAKIFMGDVGSTLLGFNIALFSIYYQNTGKTSLFVWLILSSLFWFDATLTLFRRILNKEKINLPHRKHAYQRIVQSGFSHQKTVIYSVFLNIICFIAAYLSILYSRFTLLFLLLIVTMLFFIDKLISNKKPFV